jgi:peroxiredoxin Q/BCP
MSSTPLKQGDLAPDFALESTLGHPVRLQDYRGKGPVVVYFYPKASTSVCTAEACSFRDHLSDFTSKGATVLGISTDDLPALKKFQADNHLNFPLLSDPEGKVAQAYGVRGSMKGQTVAKRVTFLVGPDGHIQTVQTLWDLEAPIPDLASHTQDVVKHVGTLAEKLSKKA